MQSGYSSPCPALEPHVPSQKSTAARCFSNSGRGRGSPCAMPWTRKVMPFRCAKLRLYRSLVLQADLMRIALALFLTVLPCTTFAAAAETWPARPVRIVSPFPAASTVDLVLRIIQPPFAERLGQPVVIDNRGGASGAIGVEVVQRATPDGYTMLLGT